jgi:hypothetical protein
VRRFRPKKPSEPVVLKNTFKNRNCGKKDTTLLLSFFLHFPLFFSIFSPKETLSISVFKNIGFFLFTGKLPHPILSFIPMNIYIWEGGANFSGWGGKTFWGWRVQNILRGTPPRPIEIERIY